MSPPSYGFYEAAVVRIDPVARKVLCRSVSVLDAEVKSVSCELHTFSLEYDVLVLAVGAVPNTFGTPGVEEARSACSSQAFPSRGLTLRSPPLL